MSARVIRVECCGHTWGESAECPRASHIWDTCGSGLKWKYQCAAMDGRTIASRVPHSEKRVEIPDWCPLPKETP